MNFAKRLLCLGMTLLAFAGGFLAFSAKPVLAQSAVTEGLTAVGTETSLSSSDPRAIVARIINIFLGLLAIIMVSIIIYAGFIWMTAGGDAAQVEKAKNYIRNAIIGLIIILSSWAITTFVISRLLGATTGGPGGSTGTGPGGGGGLGGGGSGFSFQVRSITPVGTVRLRNIEVRFLFTRDVDTSRVAGAMSVVKASDNSVVAGELRTSGDQVTFTPAAGCPNDATRKCFDADTEYIARVNTSLRSSTGQTLSCGATARPCEVRFRTGNVVDTNAPTVTIEQPFDGQSIPVDDAVRIVSRATDDSGIGAIESLADATLIGRDAPIGDATTSFIGNVLWNTSGLATGTHALQSRANDIDSNTNQSRQINVVVRPQHCFNGQRDQDETALDCGGSSCGACSGGTCTTGTQCASGVCSAGRCVDQPIILEVTPPDGRPGTFVTINGANFGSSAGHVTIGGRVATPPAACVAAGAGTWSARQIIVTVPDNGITGPVVVSSTAGLVDRSDDDRGPRLEDFIVNDVARPGLCAASPSSGLPGASVDLIGAGLGSVRGQIRMGDDREVTSVGNWTDTRVNFNAPVFAPGRYETRVITGATSSNSVAFTITERTVSGPPIIDAIEPATGTIGGYITIIGRNFGDRPNRVMFRDASQNAEGDADISFPAACSVNFWRDTSIVVKVPQNLRNGLGASVTSRPGQVQISVIRQTDSQRSGNSNFTIVAGAPGPGICAVEPVAGPIGTNVRVIGENFSSAIGSVFFKGAGAVDRVPATVGVWTASEATSTTPVGSATGRVTLRTAGGAVSNGINFQVRNCNEDANMCGRSEVCCEDTGACSVGGACPVRNLNAAFAWQTSSGRIPVNPEVVEQCNASSIASPSPWNQRQGGDAACRNADIMVRFTTHLNPTTISSSSVIVRKCTGSGSNPCSSSTPVTGSLSMTRASDDQDYVRFRPASQLDANSTYEVLLTRAITSDINIPMLENSARCGSGNAYCFRFVTRDAICEPGSIAVSPNPYTAKDVGEKVGYQGSARASDDMCIHINGSSFTWNWRSVDDGGRPDSRASFDAPINLENATATAFMETGRNPIKVLTEILTARRPTGTADLFVNFVAPRVVEYGPNCQVACTNAALWAKFSVPLNPARLTGSSIEVRKCANENCRTSSVVDLRGSVPRLSSDPRDRASRPNTYLLLEPVVRAACTATTILEPENFYKVILKRDAFVSQSSNLPIENTNDPDGFAWIFRVRPGPDARCTAATIDVAPGEKVESLVGARQFFDANPRSSADQCDAKGQPLVSDRDYTWNSSDVSVARLVSGGTLALSSEVPAYCTNRCVMAGATGIAGRVANCGNGTIETTNGHLCRRPDESACRPGDTNCHIFYSSGRFGRACTMLAPGSIGSEECDLGGANGPTASCSNRCLLNPVRRVTDTPAGTCGNGVVEEGEQCDVGRICVGGAFDGRVCSADSECGAGRCQVTERLGCSDQCQVQGSVSGFSVCGNGSVGDGEACDDGNTRSGDGCSATCLNEGASPVTSACGNGVIENGETCEKNGANWPANCNQTTCLNTGTARCATGTGTNCCGNGTRDPGEDTGCDVAPGVVAEGCSERCLKAGSSIGYTTASVCGDGIVGTGEQCDAAPITGPSCGGGSRQLAEITGTREPSPSETDRTMRSNIQATYDAKTGTGVYGLRCGFTTEQQCIDQAGGDRSYGLTTGGCCTKRPHLLNSNPTQNETQVCRNALVFGTFDGEISPSGLENNVVLAKKEATSCPAGTTLLSDLPMQAEPGFWGWVKSVWHRIVAFFTGGPAYAQVWCVGRVSGTVRAQSSPTPTGVQTTIYFILDNALEANTSYRLVFRGDRNLADTVREGLQTTRGTGMDGDAVIDFTTAAKICSANNVQLRDLNVEKPFLFTENPESHAVNAQVISSENGRVSPIVAVPEYEWAWQPWTSSEERNGILRVGATTNDPTGAFSTSSLETFQNKNGSSIITAGIQITHDEVNIPSTTRAVIEGSKTANVIICERPWPLVDSRYAVPTLADANGSPFLPGAFASGPFYQFSTLYCLDQGANATTTDDLPMLTVNATAIIPNDAARGIRRQYLMKFDDASLARDGIGIRVIDNPLHLSPSAWYASQGFSGRPQETTVDGYAALRDGTTLYVAAANADNNPAAGAVSSSIYLISVNPDADARTLDVYNQLISNWSFNINFNSDSRNSCVDNVGSVFQVDGKAVSCDADWQCDKYTTTANPLHCSASKAKLRRDTKRISDFQSMMSSFESSKQSSGQYPRLTDGTFLQSMSNSLWSSWSQNLAGQVGGSLPSDPINRFNTCGRCRQGSSLLGPCMNDSDCSTGQTCTAQVESDPNGRKNGFDPATCWNATSRRYMCPKISDYSNSHIYQYRNVDNGQRHELATELEFTDGTRYRPALTEEVKRCSNTNQICSTNTDCDVYDIGGTRVTGTGTCNGTGGRWLYRNVCGDREYGIDDICGNGVRGEREVCEVGDARPTPCSTQNNGVLDGTKVQVCRDCGGFADGPATSCVKNAVCGNGRIDRYQCQNAAGTTPGFKYGQPCTVPTAGTSSECSDPRDASLGTVDMRCIAMSPAEVCDDGALNGTYGRCNRTCSGVGAYCGDGLLSAGESCDNGTPGTGGRSSNGSYCGAGCNLANSCSIDCRAQAPHCGDNQVQSGNEQCDGNRETTNKAICSYPNMSVDPSLERPCDTNAQCGSGGVCPSDPSSTGMTFQNQYLACGADSVRLCTRAGKVCADRVTACSNDSDCAGGGVGSCQDWNKLTCATDNDCGTGPSAGRCISYPSVHSRGCGAPGSTNACNWQGWSKCQAVNSCGDGVLNAGEECDDGNTSDNDACTAQCKRNVCGDSSLYQGVEECDLGSRNGAACSAEYGTTCARCSNQCRMEASSGGFCGNGIKDIGSGEQCDGTDGVTGITCRSLGYDYASEIRCTHGAFWVAKENVCLGTGECDYPAGSIVSCDITDPDSQCAQTISAYRAKFDAYPAANQITDPNAVIPSYLTAACSSAPIEGLSCTNSCGFTGCKRCSDTPGPGERGSISATVYDAVYSTRGVPNARVTLYVQGVRVSETFTDMAGRFSFDNINTRAECVNYRIVVDSYVNNTNTPLYDEGLYGGYWPYESKTFAAPTNALFCRNGLENDDCKIYMLPRVGANQTLVVNDWNGSLPAFLDAHLVSPADITQPDPETNYQGRIMGTERAHTHWQAPGAINHLNIPHANLYCYHSDNETDTSCANFKDAPQALKFTRGDWATDGYYSFFVKNYSSFGGGTAGATYEYLRQMQFKTYIVTQDRVAKITPPTSASGDQACNGLNWFVFQQAASDGRIVVPGATANGTFPCANVQVPNEPAGTTFGPFVPN